jgi:FKBP-type peptidyl-prolyl cis-trans isomerase 2
MEKGKFVNIKYTGYIESSNEIFDLTDENKAKELGIYNPKAKYGPAKVIIGEGMMLKKLDEELHKMEVGIEKKIKITKKEGFGERNLKNIKLIPDKILKKQNINVVPGQFINFGQVQGKVLSVSSGRVKIDLNHPLAGKDLIYTIKILNEITDTKEKIEALCIKNIQIAPKIEIKKDIVNIKIPFDLPEQYQKTIETEIKKYIKEIKTVKFENIKQKEENKK